MAKKQRKQRKVKQDRSAKRLARAQVLVARVLNGLYSEGYNAAVKACTREIAVYARRMK